MLAPKPTPDYVIREQISYTRYQLGIVRAARESLQATTHSERYDNSVIKALELESDLAIKLLALMTGPPPAP